MVLELAIAGMLKCMIANKEFEGKELKCYNKCVDGTTDFARTNREYQCPKVIYVDREPVPFRERFKK